ncbi:MAG: alpha-amylase family glycosyl hydrolase [Opitutaceae bacterium]
MLHRLFLLVISCLLAGCLTAQPVSVQLPVTAVDSNTTVWVALDVGPSFGSTVVTVGQDRRVFLPFQADVILEVRNDMVVSARAYGYYQWQNVSADAFVMNRNGNTLTVEMESGRTLDHVRAVQWFTSTTDGALAADHDYFSRSGSDVYLPHYYAVVASGELELRGRYGSVEAKPRIYQMLPRLFGNDNETRKTNGTLAENGSGKFNDLSASVLAGLKADGFSHIWLTGIIQQATSTDYTDAGQAPDDPDLLKGIAGSPYAIRDYFDVSPDFADDPNKRLDEFKALTARMKAAGLDVIIDFVPNHVARSYASDIRPELAFGVSDRKDVYFDADNNFFYLTPEITDGQAPLRLPTVDPQTGQVVNETARLVGNADGYFDAERVHGRVTGNNVASWQPSNGDWYETVKLNYGFDFLHRDRAPEYPSAISPRKPIPDTWKKMDSIIAYWQELGVDGFRADMAHMVPPEFWKWMIHRAKARDPEVFFCAEAYNDDPAKVPSRDPAINAEDSVMLSLLDAGFNSVYDDPGYDTLEHLLEGKAWANDLDEVEQGLDAFFFDCALRYTENHDEIRLAHPGTWGGQGMAVGRPVTATLFGLSRGPVMIYHGQEVGEPGLGIEGFGGDDQRSSIFDYWSLPELNKWWNDGAADGAGLSAEQIALRAWYSRLLQLQTEPAFSQGNSIMLNQVNRNNPFYGKVADVGPSGHWFYAYLRSDPSSGSRYLVTSNFHANATLRHVRVRLPAAAILELGLRDTSDQWLVLKERLAMDGQSVRAIRIEDALREGIYLDRLAPLSAYYWELSTTDELEAGVIASPILPAGKAFLGAPPLTLLRAGEELLIDLRRFGNPGATHRFTSGSVDGVSVSIDRLNHQLIVSADTTAGGLKMVPLFLEPLSGSDQVIQSSLPLVVESVPSHTFTLHGYNEATSVALVGAFNSWNADADLLRKVDGGWELTKSFNAGRHIYKFVIDGSWETDPGNAQLESDGYGGHNSVVELGGGSAHASAPTLFVAGQDDRSIQIQSDQPLSTVIAEALMKSGGVVRLPVEIEGNVIKVYFQSQVPQGEVIRVIAEGVNGKVGLPAMTFAGEPLEDIWQDDIIYYAFTDRFHDGNTANTVKVADPEVLPAANYHGGDFDGIRQKLDEGYFDALGVNVIWLAPLNQNPVGASKEYLEPYRSYTGYHGYWPVDRYGVEERFGGEPALRKLISEVHGKEMKVLADFVLKHVHVDNPIRAERPELFGQLELSDGSRNLRRWNDNPYTTWFEPFLPAFDFRNPETVAFLLEDATHWIDTYDLDGYRLDAVKHIRPDFWWRFRTRMRDTFPDSNHYFVGETFQSRQGIADFVGPNMLDGQFDFPLYDTLVPCFAQGTADFVALENALRQSEEVYGRSVRMSALLGNHDKSRFMAYADGDLPDPDEPDDEEVGWKRRLTVDNPAAFEKLKLAMTFLLTIDGVPMIYYGDEIGMSGAGDPDNRRMMRFGDDVTAAEASVRAHFAKLAHTRRAHPALFMGSRRALEAGADRYAYVRAYGDDRALVLFNRSDRKLEFNLNVGPEIGSSELIDALTGASVRVRNGHVVLTLSPMSSAIYTGQQ